MDFTVENVHVTNWSKDPFLRLGHTSKAKLTLAIRYSRQIVDDSCELLAKYERARIVASVDKRMAVDYFGEHEAVTEALHKYFGLVMPVPGAKKPTGPQLPNVSTDFAGNQAKLTTILGKFRQIQAGIRGNFDLVVGGIHDGDDVKDGIKDAFRHLKNGGGVGGAWKHIKFIREGTEGWVGNRNGSQGRIHLNSDVVRTYSEGKIARVIVHEASHKYANTDDVDLLNDGTDDGSGYKWDGLKFNNKGYVGLENNADSYAWGGRLMWKRKRRLASGV
jgi:hypothetical protein